MKQLETVAPAVYKGFMDGDFVVKESQNTFNQIPDDQGLEHVNKIAKVAGGLVGITRTETALDRWSLTYNDRARLAQDTYNMIGLQADADDGDISHKDNLSSRMKRDGEDGMKLTKQFRRFSHDTHELVNLITGVTAPDDVRNDLQNALINGKQIVKKFVSVRLIDKSVKFHDSVSKRNSKTFAKLDKTLTSTDGKMSTALKASRDLFRQMVVSIEAGRYVDVDAILAQELTPVPLALATLQGRLRSTDKAQLETILEEVASVSELPTGGMSTCAIIDGNALIQAIGKPNNAKTFGDLSQVVKQAVLSKFSDHCTRVDVVFDRYQEHSVKAGTRERRSGSERPVRRLVHRCDIKLPENWKRFINLGENKANLVCFISNELSRVDPGQGRELLLSGGFSDIDASFSSVGRDVTHLKSTHEEADTRILLHSTDAETEGYSRIVVHCRDTGVLVLLVVSFPRLTKEVWMKTGTSKHPRYIAVHNIVYPQNIRNSLAAFHAITGCDTTSQFSGISKKSAWKCLEKNQELLLGFGENQVLDPEELDNAEAFICKMYDPATQFKSIQDLRCYMFRKLKKNIDKLPPTKNALVLHLQRAHYQTFVWKMSRVPKPVLPSVLDCGWSMEDGILRPTLTKKAPVSATTLKLVTCGCVETGCRCQTRQCACTRSGFICTRACKCASGTYCQNTNNYRFRQILLKFVQYNMLKSMRS